MQAVSFERDAALDRAKRAEDKASVLSSQLAERKKAVNAAIQKIGSLEAAVGKVRTQRLGQYCQALRTSLLCTLLLLLLLLCIRRNGAAYRV